jgi:hypothetical protein
MQSWCNPASRRKTKTDTHSPSQGVIRQYPVPDGWFAGKIFNVISARTEKFPR